MSDTSSRTDAGNFVANNIENISNDSIPGADLVQIYAIRGLNLNKSYAKTKYLIFKDKATKILDNLTINVAKGQMLVHFNLNFVLSNKF